MSEGKTSIETNVKNIIEGLGYRIISPIKSPHPVAAGAFADCYLIYKENQSPKQLYIFKCNRFLQNQDKTKEAVGGIALSPNFYEYIEESDNLQSDNLQACLIMDYIPGLTLNSLVDNLKDKKLKLKDYQILSILYCVAYGLNRLQKQGWAHRDIKPDNIMIDGNFCAHIIDYGEMSQKAKDTYITTGTIFGNKQYQNHRAIYSQFSLETDLYSLGCIIFFMLFQDHPFSNTKDTEMRKMKATDQFDTRLPPIKREAYYYIAVKELQSYIEPNNHLRHDLLTLIRRCCKLHPFKNKKISAAEIIKEIQRLAVENLSPDDFDKYDYVVRIANSKKLSLDVPYGTEYLVNKAVKLGFHTAKQGSGFQECKHPILLAKKYFDPQFEPNDKADSDTFRNLFEEATSIEDLLL